MKSRLVTWQLRVFVLVTAVVVSVMAVYYVKIPQQLGFGRHELTVELADTGGLYPKSLVTYRGFEVGTVESLELKPGGGVMAHLQIDDDVKIPVDAVAQVRSASVIGEQYINFLPQGDSASDETLDAGAVVPASRTALPTTTNDLLNSLDAFVGSVPPRDLRVAVRETGKAFDGADDSLASLIDDGGALTESASENLDATTRLIDDSRQVLSTQRALDPAIRSYADSLDSLTAQLEASDDDLESILKEGGSSVDSIADFTDALGGDLPPMLNEIADASEVARVYRDGIEHIFTVVPPATVMFAAGVPPSELTKARPQGNLYFKMTFPTACTTGFPHARKMRSPYDLSLAPLPRDSYCKVAPDDPRVVRGARNHPCPNGVHRGPSAASCGLVFDEEAAERSEFAHGADGTLVVDPRVAKLLAPNGPLFLLDAGSVRDPGDWDEMLNEMVGQ